jgi:hypothetical protein
VKLDAQWAFSFSFLANFDIMDQNLERESVKNN